MPDWVNRVIEGAARRQPLRTRRISTGRKELSSVLSDRAELDALYAAAVHSSNLGVLTTDSNGIVTGWNPGAERLFGYSAAEAIGRDIEFLMPADRRDEVGKIRETFRTGECLTTYATVRLTKDGRRIHVVFDISRLRDATSEQLGASAIVRDVTEQYLAELFGLAVEACPTGMMMFDRNGRIVIVNSEVEHLFGYRRDELINRPVEMLVPANLQTGHAKLPSIFTKRPQSRRMEKGRELVGLRKDGSEFPVEVELNSIHIREGLLIMAVIADISERKRIERLKDDFVSTVSHELRTPLTSIAASLALLAGGKVGELPASAQRLVAIAHNNSQRLVRLVNDILEIEKIESGKVTFRFQSVSAREIVEQVMEANRAYADQLGIRMRLESAVRGEVWADSDRLAQVVTNLLSNAIKFSPRGKDVVLAVDERPEWVRITVLDHGPGIPEEFKPRVFGKFAQADVEGQARKGGTGLGLSIAQQIVNRLGGEVGFESAVGIGTLFFIDLPRSGGPEHEKMAAASTSEFLS